MIKNYDMDDNGISLNENVEEIPLSSRPIFTKDESDTSDKYNTTEYKSFHYLENGSIDFSVLATKFTKKKLLPGVYDLYSTIVNGLETPKLKVNNEMEKFDQDLSYLFEDKIKKAISSFFNKEMKFKINKLGYKHKIGIILHGKQGTGKTSMFKKHFTRLVEEENAIVFVISRWDYFYCTWEFIQDIRKIQDNPIIIFMDEFEEIFDNPYNEENFMKKVMDGFNSIDNSLFMMATNYIDKVPKTIKTRKSRVKYCIEVKGIEDLSIIERFLNSCFDKIDMSYDFSEDIKKMKGYTVDELKQYVLDVIMDLDKDFSTNVSKMGFNGGD